MKLHRLPFGLTACCAILFASCDASRGGDKVGRIDERRAAAPRQSQMPIGEWPQWRGPQRDDISQETGLLPEWPKDGPKLLWKINDAGSGYSTPAVVGDRLYMLGSKGTDDEFVEARSIKDGSRIWSQRIGKVGKPDQKPSYPGARSTPTFCWPMAVANAAGTVQQPDVDGPVLYALGSAGDLVCIGAGSDTDPWKAASGKVLWKKNLPDDFQGEAGTWAYAESPLIDGDQLVCTPGGSDATIVALDKKTGEVMWKSAVPGGDKAAYSSIVISEAAGVKQYVQFLAKGVVGVDAKTGKFLWRYKKTADSSPANIPTPLVDGDYIYSATGKGGGGLIKIERDDSQKTGDALKVEEIYSSAKLPTAIGGVVKVGDYMYGTNSQALMCVKFLTGEIVWSERGIGAGSILYADGRLYLHGENGDVALVEASPKAYKELGRFTPSDEPDRGHAKAWAYPVVSNGRLYIRDVNMLWCYEIKDAKPK